MTPPCTEGGHHRPAPRGGGTSSSGSEGEVLSPCLHLRLPFMHHVKHIHGLSSFIRAVTCIGTVRYTTKANIHYKHWQWPKDLIMVIFMRDKPPMHCSTSPLPPLLAMMMLAWNRALTRGRWSQKHSPPRRVRWGRRNWPSMR